MITFETDNDVIVYGPQKILLFCRERHLLFPAHCVRWLASLTGLYQGLVIHIDNFQTQAEIVIAYDSSDSADSCIPLDTCEIERHDMIIKDCKDFLQQSEKKRIELAGNTGSRSRLGSNTNSNTNRKQVRRK